MINNPLDLSTWQKCLELLPTQDKETQLYIINCFRANEAQFKRDLNKLITKKNDSNRQLKSNSRTKRKDC
jgi:hypothetical protein